MMPDALDHPTSSTARERTSLRAMQAVAGGLILVCLLAVGSWLLITGAIYTVIPQLPRISCAPAAATERAAVDALSRHRPLTIDAIKVRDVNGVRLAAIRSGTMIALFRLTESGGTVTAAPANNSAELLTSVRGPHSLVGDHGTFADPAVACVTPTTQPPVDPATTIAGD